MGRPTTGRSPQALGAKGSRGPRPPRPRAVSQLPRLWVYGPEDAESCARQAGASHHHVLRRVLLLSTHAAERRRARGVAALLAVWGQDAADPVQVTACEAPVPRSHLVHVDGVLPFLGENRLQGPASHDPPE